MRKTREQKEEILEQFKELLKEQKPLILVDYRGLDGREISLLRKDLQASRAQFKVVKTTLFRKALKGTKLSIGQALLKRPIAIVYDSETIPLSKVVYQFSQIHPELEILGGILEGKFSEESQIKEMALLPSIDELEVRLVQTLKFSLLRLDFALSDLSNRLILALKNIEGRSTSSIIN